MMRILAVSIFSLIPFVTGCDAIVPAAQPVVVKVTERQTKLPVASATIEKPRANPARPTTAEVANTREIVRLDSTETRPDGVAQIDINMTYIRGGLNGLLFEHPDEDRLTGTVCDLRVTHGETTETLPVKLSPGTSTAGQFFDVQVQSVGRPYELRSVPRPTTRQ